MPHSASPGRPDDSAVDPPADGAVLSGADLAALLERPAGELRAEAEEAGLVLPPLLERAELAAALCAHRLRNGGLGTAAGVLELLSDGYGFLRSAALDFVPSPADTYVSPSQVRRLNLRTGQELAGAVRPPQRGERFFALARVESVDGDAPDTLGARVAFASRTPVLPTQRLPLLHRGAPIAIRCWDAFAPFGLGHRVLLACAPDVDRCALLHELATALVTNRPDLQIVACLLDGEPAAAPRLRAALGCRATVVGAPCDEPPLRQAGLADLALQRAMRLLEAGRDVVLLLDSLTALARASHFAGPPSGRLLCTGLDAAALLRPRRLFGAARATEEGGALTVVATAVADPEDRIGQAILGEFRGRGHAEVWFDAHGLDVSRSATRREDLLLEPAAVHELQRRRAELLAMPPEGRAARARSWFG